MDDQHATAIADADRALVDAVAAAEAACGQLANAVRRALDETPRDDAQLATLNLQNVLQKQQQTLQMMSDISKTLYDTAIQVIRKMGG
jgi:hypothetical protein